MQQLDILVAGAAILLFLGGIAFFQGPRTARLGGWLNITAYSGAVLFVLIRYPAQFPVLLMLSVLAGGVIGGILAVKISMRDVPQMVALQNGCGGAAALVIALAEYIIGGSDLAYMPRMGCMLGIVVGAVTFSGSLVAAGKLAGITQPRPVTFPQHVKVLLGLSAAALILSLLSYVQIGLPIGTGWAVLLVITSLVLGVIYTIRIGGADMPVIISFFNANTGFAASFVGIALNNYLLIGCGACVAASGSLLTISMCQAMNRSGWDVLFGVKRTISKVSSTAHNLTTAPADNISTTPFDRALTALTSAKDVIIAPGYGMALSQAQEAVHQLERWLESQGAQVRYAIHPVAGRMPGHMNVLLAEAGVEYDKLYELDAINDSFKQADLALVIGACDVVNPAAATQEDTPITGMPILQVHQAQTAIVLNQNEQPGFSGVPNPLYHKPQSVLLWGDARENLNRLLGRLTVVSQQTAESDTSSLTAPLPVKDSPLDLAVSALKAAKDVIIAPGYGMALSQAQEAVHQLERWLESQGAQVRYAIHPVAGRMPGHMNVLLAEAGVEYDKLYELDAINDSFKQADLALVIGACDVVNPAAATQEDTPITGMPILQVHQAQTAIVLNQNEQPGFSGVPNPLYHKPQSVLLWGDARENLNRLLGLLDPHK